MGTGNRLLIRRTTGGANHDMKPSKVKQDCTICVSLLSDRIGFNRTEMAGESRQIAGIIGTSRNRRPATTGRAKVLPDIAR